MADQKERERDSKIKEQLFNFVARNIPQVVENSLVGWFRSGNCRRSCVRHVANQTLNNLMFVRVLLGRESSRTIEITGLLSFSLPVWDFYEWSLKFAWTNLTTNPSGKAKKRRKTPLQTEGKPQIIWHTSNTPRRKITCMDRYLYPIQRSSRFNSIVAWNKHLISQSALKV